jgi:hypothetical protein
LGRAHRVNEVGVSRGKVSRTIPELDEYDAL